MSSLREALADYLRLRRQLGHPLVSTGKRLDDFVEFMERVGATTIRTVLAVEWATLPKDVHPLCWNHRLGMVRGFARYLSAVEPATEVPPMDLLPARQPRLAPYIYSEQEIVALMRAAGRLECSRKSPLRATTYEALIGLLAATGVRIGEALGLDRGDVDLVEGVMTVAAKHARREVPVHDSTTGALADYAQRRDRQWPVRTTDAFFLSGAGKRLSRTSIRATFGELIAEVGLDGAGHRLRPRLHDLRHTFAVHTLVDWYRGDEDVDHRLLELSTYLGHKTPVSTYCYLEAVPELLELVAPRLDDVLGAGS
jgi:integrase/recombinase XerD